MEPAVVSVSRDSAHNFSKPLAGSIVLEAGLGVVGDAHFGVTVQHRTLVAKDPSRPNSRQVHLIHSELFEELRAAGFELRAGDLGENILTKGVDLLALPTGTRLRIGADAIVEMTGLRNPCRQIERFQPGLQAALLYRDETGELVRKAGVMGVVSVGGLVRPGDPIGVELPDGEHRPLGPL
jgi:MOSC domain-containing protein YiiM